MTLPKGADLAALQAEAEAKFRDSGLRWSDSRRAAPGVERFVDRIGAFLVLVGLAGLAVGGVGVAAAVRAYLEAKIATIATLAHFGRRRRADFPDLSDANRASGRSGRCASGLGLGIGLPLASGRPDRGRPALSGRGRPFIRALCSRRPSTASRRRFCLRFGRWRGRNRCARQRFIAAACRRAGRAGAMSLSLIALAGLLIGGAVVLSGTWQLWRWARRAACAALLRAGAGGLGPGTQARAGWRAAAGRAAGWRCGWRWPSIGAPRAETTQVVLALGPGPFGAGGGRADRRQPAQRHFTRPARPRTVLLLRRYPARSDRRFSRHSGRQPCRDQGGKRADAARHHHQDQR